MPLRPSIFLMCVDMFPRSFSENLHAFGIAALSDWNSLADYQHDQAPELHSFRRQFKTFLLVHVHCWVQYTENIRDTMTVCRKTCHTREIWYGSWHIVVNLVILIAGEALYTGRER